MGNGWSTAAVGPQHRAISRDGEVRAIAESTELAAQIVRHLNTAEQPGVAAAMRDELEQIRASLEAQEQAATAYFEAGYSPALEGASLTRAQVIERIDAIMKIGQEDVPDKPRAGSALVLATLLRAGRPSFSVKVQPGTGVIYVVDQETSIRVDRA